MKTSLPHTREKKCVGMSCKCKCHYPPYWRGKLIPCTECETPKKETPPSQKKQVKEDCGYALNCLMPNGKYCKKHQPPQEELPECDCCMWDDCGHTHEPNCSLRIAREEELKKIEKAIKEGFEESEKHLKENPNYPYPQEEEGWEIDWELVKQEAKIVFERVIRATMGYITGKGYTVKRREDEYDRAYKMLRCYIRGYLSSQRQKYIEAIDGIERIIAELLQEHDCANDTACKFEDRLIEAQVKIEKISNAFRAQLRKTLSVNK